MILVPTKVSIVNSTGAIVENVLVEVAIYAPMIHTASCVMLLMGPASITRVSGKRPFHRARKSLDFQDPTPFNLTKLWMRPASKALRTGSYKS